MIGQISGDQFTYDAETDKKNNRTDESPLRLHASPVGIVESKGKEHEKGHDPGGKAEQPEHDAAYCLSYYAENAEIGEENKCHSRKEKDENEILMEIAAVVNVHHPAARTAPGRGSRAAFILRRSPL